MQAAKLEADGDWSAVLELTERWAQAEAGNAEAWLVRGQAYQHLDRDADSIQPLRTALNRDPTLGTAWFDLGTSYVRSGDKTALREVLVALKSIDPDLADDLAVRGGVEH
jgi:cytochrome c-type biogenesis protein CcmH/NrfG